MSGEHRFGLILCGMMFALSMMALTAGGAAGWEAMVVTGLFGATASLIGIGAMLAASMAATERPDPADWRGRAYLSPDERRAADSERAAVANARRVLAEHERKHRP